MKTLAVLMLLLAATPGGSAGQGMRTYSNATVVAADVQNGTLTIMGTEGSHDVLGVQALARPRLKELKAGASIILATQETAPGVREVTAIDRLRRTTTSTAATGGRRSRTPTPAAPPSAPAASRTPTRSSGEARPVTDTDGPQHNAGEGARPDPGKNPSRDPRVIPGLAEPAGPPRRMSPTPSGSTQGS